MEWFQSTNNEWRSIGWLTDTWTDWLTDFVSYSSVVEWNDLAPTIVTRIELHQHRTCGCPRIQSVSKHMMSDVVRILYSMIMKTRSPSVRQALTGSAICQGFQSGTNAILFWKIKRECYVQFFIAHSVKLHTIRYLDFWHQFSCNAVKWILLKVCYVLIWDVALLTAIVVKRPAVASLG